MEGYVCAICKCVARLGIAICKVDELFLEILRDITKPLLYILGYLVVDSITEWILFKFLLQKLCQTFPCYVHAPRTHWLRAPMETKSEYGRAIVPNIHHQTRTFALLKNGTPRLES